MMRQNLSIGLVAAAFTVSLSPVWAQERERPNQGESRPSSGEGVGSAVPRGSDAGSSSSSSPSSNSGSASSSNGSSSSQGSSAAWMGGNAPGSEGRAPVHPDRAAQRAEAADQRRGGGTSTGHAVPRGESGGKTNGGSTSGSSTSASGGSEREPSQGRSRAVPTYSRPRDGRNPTGTAVERTTPIPNRGGVYYPGVIYDPYYSYYGYDPYYSRYSYWNPYGYGYGLGYFSYDPFLFSGMGSSYYGGMYDPYSYSGGGGGGYSSGYSQGYREVGSLRLKVKPSNAQVHIDGYYVGVIDSFDGSLQRLRVEAGKHRVELTAEGYEPVQFEVMIIPGDTITYKGEMKRR